MRSNSVINSDYAPIQAVVLVTALFTTLVFLIVDLLYFLARSADLGLIMRRFLDSDLWRFARAARA